MPGAIRLVLGMLVVVGMLLLALQLGSAANSFWAMSRSEAEAAGAPSGKLDEGKKRQELIAAAYANWAKRYPWDALAAGLGSAMTVVIALSGGVIALQQYLDARAKERADRRDAQDKELQAREAARLDRLAADLKTTLDHLGSKDPRMKLVAVAGLQHFFGKDKADFHLQALAALVSTLRSELRTRDPDRELIDAIRVALAQAARAMEVSVLRQLSWRGLPLRGVDLVEQNLSGLDLREADLEDARLAGANLVGADLTLAKLKGADLAGARLEGAVLSFADLAGADLKGAVLGGAWIDGMGVRDVQLEGANLRGVQGDWRAIPWDRAIGWRKADFDAGVAEELIAKYGPAASGPHVVMLMWEIPPLVAGGTWTACYHMVRNLRRAGANVTVVVPWSKDMVLAGAFGGETPIVALGIEPPDQTAGGVYGAAYGGAYGGGHAGLWSAYGGGPALWSGYATASSAAIQGPYARVVSAYGQPSPSGSALMRLVGEFAREFRRRVVDLKPDLIHANDWVTFAAAQQAAQAQNIPWIAHVHSTELERRQGDPDPIILRTERAGLGDARRIITPGHITKQRVIEEVGLPAERISVIPNMLSGLAPPAREMGRFEDRKVVFLGRLTPQKGLDRFAEMAAQVAPTVSGSRFEVFGDGEARGPLERGYPISFRGPLGWDQRGEAFRGASVLVVPSRAEPFGMVVLEAMLHRTAVIYPNNSGAAEALETGVKVDPADIEAMSAQVRRLLTDWAYWEELVEAQAIEIADYPSRDYPQRIAEVWGAALEEAPPVAAASG